MSKILSSLLLLAVLFRGGAAFAAPRPDWSFRVLHTEHFDVIFRDDQRELARRYALAAEQAYEVLIPIFKEGPEITTIFIDDDTDQSNGLTTFLPYPLITVFPVLPTTLESIDDYGDWPFEVIVHEYAHVLNMYPRHGFYWPFKMVFGSIVRPNAILPKWYLEGLAVDMESHLSDHGRLRAPETQGEARALSLGKSYEHEDIAKINEQELGTWPYGDRPYLFGGWWWNEAQGDKGTDFIYALNQNFSRRLPWFLNGPIREQTGTSAVGMLRASLAKVDAKAEADIQILKQKPVTQGTEIDTQAGEQFLMAVSPDGNRLVYTLGHPALPGSPISGTEMRVKTRTSKGEPFSEIKPQVLFKTTGAMRIRWIDNDRIVYDSIDPVDPYLRYRDLYLYDFKTARVRRLTRGMRAQEAAPSPKGDILAFILNDGGRNHLAMIPLGVNPVPVILANSSYQQRFSGPEFINDHDIVFAVRQRSGHESLFVFDLNTHKISTWNTGLKSAQNARFTSKGMLVSDDRTHVRNIYHVEAGSQPGQALTNTLTHIETSDYDPQRQELIVSELTPKGRRLKSIPYASAEPPTIEPVKIEPAPTPKTTKIKISEDSYSPLGYLYPRFWMPFIYNIENGYLIQGSTFNYDPTGRNTYTLDASIDSITGRPSYDVSYTNGSLPLNIGLGYSDYISYLGASKQAIESRTGGISFSDAMWPFNSSFVSWHLGEQWSDTSGVFGRYRRLGPNIGLAYNRMQTPLNTWAGYMLEANFQDNLPNGNYVQYARTYVHGAVTFPVFGWSKVFMQARAAMAPQMPYHMVPDIGDRSLGGNYIVNIVNSDFLLRGYPSATFVGREAVNANFEYSLPVMETTVGLGTFPVYLRALEIVGFFDTMATDGFGWRSDLSEFARTNMKQWFSGTGAELRLSTTFGYQLPVTFTAGAYYGLNKQFSGGFTPFIGFGFSDLPSLQHKTP